MSAISPTLVTAVLDELGIKGVGELEKGIIAEAVGGLVDVLGNAALKRASAAGEAAAAKITTPDEAEAAARSR